MGSVDRQAAATTPGELRQARLAVTAVFFVNGALVASWAPYIPRIKADLGLSTSALGVVLLAMAVGAVAAMPAAGFLVERYGARAIARGWPSASRTSHCRSCCSRRVRSCWRACSSSWALRAA